MQDVVPDKDDLGFSTDPHFGTCIIQEQLPKHFKISQLEIYDGLTNSVDHLERLKALMLLHGAIDEVLCGLFFHP